MRIQGVDCGQGYGLARALFLDGALKKCGPWLEADEGDLEPAWCVDVNLIELPQIYKRMKGDPNDLVTVAAIAGRVRQAIGWHRCEFISPRSWKGTLDGDMMHVRIVKALTDDERKVYFDATDPLPEGVRHNVADAIGIVLAKLGRLTAQSLTTRRERAIKKTRRRA